MEDCPFLVIFRLARHQNQHFISTLRYFSCQTQHRIPPPKKKLNIGGKWRSALPCSLMKVWCVSTRAWIYGVRKEASIQVNKQSVPESKVFSMIRQYACYNSYINIMQILYHWHIVCKNDIRETCDVFTKFYLHLSSGYMNDESFSKKWCRLGDHNRCR